MLTNTTNDGVDTVSEDTRMLDIRSLPSTREVVSHAEGGLFPVQIVMANGEIAVISRGGAGHLGQAGRLALARSRDAGLAWTPPAVIVDSDQDDRNPAFGVTPAGTVILSYMRQASYTEERQYKPAEVRNADVCVMRSTDNGLSWSRPEVLDPEVYGLLSPFGRIVTLADGSIAMPIYTAGGTRTLAGGSYFLRSTDDGLTWSEPRLISLDKDETTLVQLASGELVAGLRETQRDHQRLWLSRSADAGETWSEPTVLTGDFQHPSDLLMLDNDTLLLLYGNRQNPYRIEGRVSRDGGQTWDQTLLLFSGQLYGYELPDKRPTDMGYPSGVVSADGSRLVVTYYVNTFPRIQEREWTGPWTTPFYQADGYKGISVSVELDQMLDALT
jgi:Neuraminidase (sialidase)